MGIEWFRDLVICIAGLVFTGVLVVIAVMAYSLFKRTKTALELTQDILTTTKKFSTYVQDEAVKPLVQVLALIQGVRQGINTFSTLFKKDKEGGRDV